MRIRTHVCVVVGIILLGTAFGAAQQGAPGASWPRVGGDQGVTRYAPLDQITKSNVAQLRIAWRRPAVDVSIASRLPNQAFGSLRASPVMVDGVLYSPNGLGLVEASHPGTGKTLWVQQPFRAPMTDGDAGSLAVQVSLIFDYVESMIAADRFLDAPASLAPYTFNFYDWESRSAERCDSREA